jgi:hypothetical protein
MILGTVLVLAGLWWGYEVWRRPERTRQDFRGPALMTGIGAAIILAYLALLALA